jgi:hypothetical protein
MADEDRKGFLPMQDHHKPMQDHHNFEVTRKVKVLFGMGFCIETMFDVSSDTLLAKFYAGTRLLVLSRRRDRRHRRQRRGCVP